MFCVLDHRERIYSKGARKGQIENWMYHTLWETWGTYYLNVRESTFIIFLSSQVILFCTFSFFFKEKKNIFASLFKWLKQKNNNNQNVLLIF